MAWRGNYYYSSRRVDGRVVSEYMGKGAAAILAAQRDNEAKEQRRAERLARGDELAMDRLLDELDRRVRLLARAELVLEGYHDHRGRWQRRGVRGPRRAGNVVGRGGEGG